MYGQDLYFVTVVAIIGFVFLVVAMILERIFDRWEVITIPIMDIGLWKMVKTILISTKTYNAGRFGKPVRDVINGSNYSHNTDIVIIVLLKLNKGGTFKVLSTQPWQTTENLLYYSYEIT